MIPSRSSPMGPAWHARAPVQQACIWPSKARTRPHRIEPFPAPVDPAISRCVPCSRTDQRVPSSRRPTGSARRSAATGVGKAGMIAARASRRTSSRVIQPGLAVRTRHKWAPNPWARAVLRGGAQGEQPHRVDGPGLVGRRQRRHGVLLLARLRDPRVDRAHLQPPATPAIPRQAHPRRVRAGIHRSHRETPKPAGTRSCPRVPCPCCFSPESRERTPPAP
jgi:hypothetical protein